MSNDDTMAGPHGSTCWWGECRECGHWCSVCEDWTKNCADNGHTVALPPTQQQAVDVVVENVTHALHKNSGWMGARTEWRLRARVAVRAVLSAPPEVLAAALGGTVAVAEHGEVDVTERSVVLVLPSREVDGT